MARNPQTEQPRSGFEILKRPPWSAPDHQITPEEIYCDRRNFLKGLGQVGITALALTTPFPWRGLAAGGAQPAQPSLQITPEKWVGGYNNFYEFTSDKARVRQLARDLPLDPWSIQVQGLVKHPGSVRVDDLIQRMPQEERIYRLRCVETWSAVIPWTGFPLRKWIETLEPLPAARYVKFTTFLNPNIAPGQKDRFWEPWPYTEGLRLDEAMNDLAFMAVGIYGHKLPPQNGAPIRLVVPWKYGFKSIKSIVAVEFTRQAPSTFWQSADPLEYDFDANVLPQVPYARWDQRVERPLGKNLTVPTLPYNGYADQVASLYKK